MVSKKYIEKILDKYSISEYIDEFPDSKPHFIASINKIGKSLSRIMPIPPKIIETYIETWISREEPNGEYYLSEEYKNSADQIRKTFWGYIKDALNGERIG